MIISRTQARTEDLIERLVADAPAALEEAHQRQASRGRRQPGNPYPHEDILINYHREANPDANPGAVILSDDELNALTENTSLKTLIQLMLHKMDVKTEVDNQPLTLWPFQLQRLVPTDGIKILNGVRSYISGYNRADLIKYIARGDDELREQLENSEDHFRKVFRINEVLRHRNNQSGETETPGLLCRCTVIGTKGTRTIYAFLYIDLVRKFATPHLMDFVRRLFWHDQWSFFKLLDLCNKVEKAWMVAEHIPLNWLATRKYLEKLNHNIAIQRAKRNQRARLNPASRSCE